MHRSLLGIVYLVAFFCFAYLVLALAITGQATFLNKHVTALVLTAGAIFVWLGIALGSLLLREIERTLHSVVPICACCKNVRREGGSSTNPDDWQRIENYISERSGVDFSHGFCPECYENELRALQTNA